MLSRENWDWEIKHVHYFQVDHSRVNEFGFSGDMLEEAEKKKIEGTTHGEASQSLNGGNQNALVNEISTILATWEQQSLFDGSFTLQG